MAINQDVNLRINAENKSEAGIKSSIKDLLGLDDAAKGLANTLKSAFAVGAIVEGVKALGSAMYDCVVAFGEGERAQIQLKSALGGNEQSYLRNNKLIDSLSEKTLDSKDSVEKLVAELASLGYSDQKIAKVSSAALALSNITGQDLKSAFTQLNGTYDGTVGKLGKLIPELNSLTKSELESGKAIDLVNQKMGGISDAMSTGVAQSIHNQALAFDELSEAIGQAAASSFQPIIDGITGIAKAWTDSLINYNKYQEAIGSQLSPLAKTNLLALGGDNSTLTNADALKTKMAQEAKLFADMFGKLGGVFNGPKDNNRLDGLAKLYSLSRDQVVGLILDTQNLTQEERTYYSLKLSAEASLARFKAKERADKASTDASNRPDAPHIDKAKTTVDAELNAINSLSEQLKELTRKWDYYDVSIGDQTSQLKDFQFSIEKFKGLDMSDKADSAFSALIKQLKELQAAYQTSTNSSANATQGTSWYGTSIMSASVPATNGGSGSGGSGSGSSADFSKLIDIMGSIKGVFSNGLSGVVGNLGGLLQGGLTKLIEGLGPQFEKMITKIIPAISKGAASAFAQTGIGIVIAILVQILTGLIQVLGPALENTIKPLMNVLTLIGQMLGSILIPILNALSPIFALIALTIGEAIIPQLQIYAPLLSMLAEVLNTVVLPIIKGLAIALEVLNSPIKFMGDVFTYVADVIKTAAGNIRQFFWNITNGHLEDSKTYGMGAYKEFKSDAFSGLEARIKKITDGYQPTKTEWEAMNTDWLAQLELTATPTYTTTDIPGTPTSTVGSPATYTSQNVTINVNNYGPIAGDDGLNKFAGMVKNIFDQQVSFGY